MANAEKVLISNKSNRSSTLLCYLKFKKKSKMSNSKYSQVLAFKSMKKLSFLLVKANSEVFTSQLQLKSQKFNSS